MGACLAALTVVLVGRHDTGFCLQASYVELGSQETHEISKGSHIAFAFGLLDTGAT